MVGYRVGREGEGRGGEGREGEGREQFESYGPPPSCLSWRRRRSTVRP